MSRLIWIYAVWRSVSTLHINFFPSNSLLKKKQQKKKQTTNVVLNLAAKELKATSLGTNAVVVMKVHCKSKAISSLFLSKALTMAGVTICKPTNKAKHEKGLILFRMSSTADVISTSKVKENMTYANSLREGLPFWLLLYCTVAGVVMVAVVKSLPIHHHSAGYILFPLGSLSPSWLFWESNTA